jgi:hypothetical protein
MDFKLGELARLIPRRSGTAALFSGPAQVRAYWEALRKDGGIPDRTQLDPRGLGGVLDRVFLAERIGKGLVQVRIAGSALTEVAGMDLRGLPLSCLFAAEYRDMLALALEPVTNGSMIVELDLGANRGGPGAVGRLLLLPLADGGDRRLVLGCLGMADGLIGPRLKLSILRKQEERVTPLAHPAPVAAPQRRAPYLTLVHTSN